MNNEDQPSTENNPYQGYANYQAPRRSYNADDLGYPSHNKGLLRNPVIATLSLLIGASLLAGVIIIASPSPDEEIIPVIKANASPTKTVPDDPGGIEIPNSDSTVFAQLGSQKSKGVNVEDLLANAKSEIDVKADMVKKNAETIIKSAPKTINTQLQNKDIKTDINKAKRSLKETKKELAKTKDILKKPETIHAAAASPDTISFIESVLDKSDVSETTTSKPAIKITAPTAPAKPKVEIKKIAPVQVTSSTAPKATPNAALSHYVQLSSIRDQKRAAEQWSKLKSKYSSALSNSNYRIQKKDLGAKGIYYRIQAGPFSKNDAADKCSAIKAITPSGCYLVAK